jgi:TRAP-type C4-dicarboxylate transport system permease small subunit
LVLEAITIVALFAMVASTLLSVLDRFLFGFGLPWPEELARFLLIWTSLLSAAIAAKHKAHFRLTFLSDKFGPWWEDLIDVLCVAAMLLVAWKGIELSILFNMQRSPALNLPMSYVYASVPVSCLLIAYYLVRNLVARRRASNRAEG